MVCAVCMSVLGKGEAYGFSSSQERKQDLKESKNY